MAITQAMCTRFKRDVMLGLHDLDSDTIKIALFTSAATLSASTTAYNTNGDSGSTAVEVANGNGYTTGGFRYRELNQLLKTAPVDVLLREIQSLRQLHLLLAVH